MKIFIAFIVLLFASPALAENYQAVDVGGLTVEYKCIDIAGCGKAQYETTIPVDPKNKSYRRFLIWIGEGNTPRPDPAASGFYKPAWNGSAWVEGETANEANIRVRQANAEAVLAGYAPLIKKGQSLVAVQNYVDANFPSLTEPERVIFAKVIHILMATVRSTRNTKGDFFNSDE